MRWARILKSLGHQVVIGEQYQGRSSELLVALHARRSHPSVQQFAQRHPERPIVVALTGTDLYRDVHRSSRARQSLEIADYLVVLQPYAVNELPPVVHDKARVIYQSTDTTDLSTVRNSRHFQVVVLGHLRAVKDPFRTALALKYLPERSKIRVLQIGQALDARMAIRARLLASRTTRYNWVGELPRWRARRILASSKLLVLSSRMEGGANVISEAVVDDVPVLASRIPGSVGLLREDYAGYFPVGDTRALADLLLKAETDPGFYRKLKVGCRQIAPLFRPAHERASWKRLLDELARRG
jgi:putative glycosyltransferase (TIGR04348 family)